MSRSRPRAWPAAPILHCQPGSRSATGSGERLWSEQIPHALCCDAAGWCATFRTTVRSFMRRAHNEASATSHDPFLLLPASQNSHRNLTFTVIFLRSESDSWNEQQHALNERVTKGVESEKPWPSRSTAQHGYAVLDSPGAHLVPRAVTHHRLSRVSVILNGHRARALLGRAGSELHRQRL